ncbi:hypothetical protein G7085_09365 [Tessaracoccus sp. HDW20]|uniref:hypothetical protein n=1 Tax=Tessaracoccus coleopterorum TaxID=2714950 RepID=UPI0018D2F04A|nr:hypothetical protein [Tessaracoccus coleopterorum]NHB84746.1 hypothetical protein [Tessaracoccus coleopterorum]
MFAALPDRAEREAELDDAPQPEFVQVIVGLTDRAGLTLDRITAGSPSPEGIVWHFLTGQGAYRYVQQGNDAVLFADEDDAEVLRVPVAELVTHPEGHPAQTS